MTTDNRHTPFAAGNAPRAAATGINLCERIAKVLGTTAAAWLPALPTHGQ